MDLVVRFVARLSVQLKGPCSSIPNLCTFLDETRHSRLLPYDLVLCFSRFSNSGAVVKGVAMISILWPLERCWIR